MNHMDYYYTQKISVGFATIFTQKLLVCFTKKWRIAHQIKHEIVFSLRIDEEKG